MDTGNKSSTPGKKKAGFQPGHTGISVTDRMGRRICPHCLHKTHLKSKMRKMVRRGGMENIPSPNGGPPTKVLRYIPLYAWLDPGSERALLHVLIRGPRGGTYYISLWLEDLDAILDTRTEQAITFTLSPDVRLLETQGVDILRNGFPKAWLKALKRGYVKPSEDLSREYKGILDKI